jgi:FAD/FMN-containing dehydrogenase/Fe-S oxidoreductase
MLGFESEPMTTQPVTENPEVWDRGNLERELRDAVRGDVLFDSGARAMYSTDASNYRQVPIGVVRPRDATDVIAAVSVARRHDAPILGRGGGTSLAGQCCNHAVVLDMSRYMNRIIDLDPEARLARVQPGVILDRIRERAEEHGLTFGPDPATHDRCTIGGMIGNNSCGVHSIMSGKTDANIESLEVLTYDGVRMRVGPTSEEELERIVAAGGRRGEIYAKLREIRDRYGELIRQKVPQIPRNVSGYNLEQLLPENGFDVARALVGTESTCVLVLEATVKLIPSPPHRILVVAGYEDVYLAADAVPEIMELGPIGLEGIDDNLIRDMKKKNLHPDAIELLPEGAGWLLIEFGGWSFEEALEKAHRLTAKFDRKRKHKPSWRLYDEAVVAKTVWKTRESALGVTAVVPGQAHAWEGWEDSAVRPERLGRYLRDLAELMREYGYRTNLYGHFGDGCVHTRIDFDLESAPGIRDFREFVERAAHLVVKHGGSLSGEHGDGQARGELLPIMFGEELMEAFREFKRAWDPDWKMNPGKVIDPYRLDENLRLGAGYSPWRPETVFRYPQDEGDFAKASLRCVGVGSCRREESGTMCPSYMVTREEKHSTRGRARLLFEMVEGEVITDGWDSVEVREALDLCLSCKGCRFECPTIVDMATYKAEFLHHHYKRRLRPPAAYAMGLIPYWARIASQMPGAVNALLENPLIARLAKAAGGIAPERQIPRFAPRRFRDLFEPGKRNGGSERVLLWPDTFNDHFRPETALAAVALLDAAGYRVDLPPDGLCCGRPFYDFGFLGLAKKNLRRILDSLRDEIRAGTLIVGIEPSCIAVFRDELVNLFPDDEDAVRLSEQVLTLAEALSRPGVQLPLKDLDVEAIVQGHCHQKAVMKMTPDLQLLERAGVHPSGEDYGCCGMAGAFGFEKEHYGVSVAVGERKLLPAVREASPETVIVADGFSCREQIEQETGRYPLHLAEILLQSLGRDLPEAPPATRSGRGEVLAVIAGAGVVLGGLILWKLFRRR